MQIATIPQFLRLSGRPCLMLGDNMEAMAKGRALINAGAQLRVIAKNPKAWPVDLMDTVTWLAEPFHPNQLDGVWLVVSALDDEKINAQLFAACQERKIFLNVVDQPQYCSFIWPAIIKRPPFTVAVSSGGQGPALSGWLRRRLAAQLPDDMEGLVEWFAGWRKETALALPTLAERGKFWRTLLDGGVADTFLSGDVTAADDAVKKALEEKKQ